MLQGGSITKVIREKDPNKWAPKAGGASEKKKNKEKKVCKCMLYVTCRKLLY